MRLVEFKVMEVESQQSATSDQETRMPHPSKPQADSSTSQQLTVRPPSQSGVRLVVYTRDEQRVFPLTVGNVIGIGRASSNNICLDDPLISRIHVRIYAGATIEVEDLGSANGSTLVRGQRNSEPRTAAASLPSHRLRPNQRVTMVPWDVLRVGNAVVVLEDVADVSDAPAVLPSRTPILTDTEMRRVYELARRAAASEISVLILGETGVGKEVLAETIHRAAMRGSAAFLKLSCPALSETLLESELLGHERSVLAGANSAKNGLLESTNGGTVFLDEIGEMPLGTQAKLLRLLEDRTVTRLGSSKSCGVDVQFVAATNHDLARDVRQGRFREDLFYRIGGLVVQIPPLRQRQSDIEPLARHFLGEFCRRTGKLEPELSPSAVGRLRQHSWPGNVRELRNVMARAALLYTGGIVTHDHVQLELQLPSGAAPTDGDTQVFDTTTVHARSACTAALNPRENGEADSERQRVIRALEECGGNQTQAARLLGVSRRTLVNRLEQFGLPRPRKR